MRYPVENALFQWEGGYRDLEAARSNPSLYRVLGRAVVAVQDELRKRLGSSFSIDELVSVYTDSTDWALDVTLPTATDEVPVLDSSVVVDAAFYLYMREAADFAGGSPRARRR